ncbi:CU044_5270 family protein [Lentzea sp. NPDC005914]|uniref:CU044_5270 family protein n=1 Tax=Lentzea sp. NPDC005914 TaxID=3154572 RepID=UPI0033F5F4CA
MDDLQLVRELDETPLKSADQLAAARAQFVAGMKPPKRGRAGIIAIATLTAAASVAAVAMVLPSDSPDSTDAAPTAPVETAVQLLNHAAAAVRSKPDEVPRPDQFYYLRRGEYEAWFSVDGTRDGRISTSGNSTQTTTSGCVDGRSKVRDKYDRPTGATEECTPRRAYRDDLPATADDMLKFLQGDDKGRSVNSYGKDVLAMFSGAYLPGPQRAALFEAATRVPGLTVVQNVSSGRPGIGISWPVPEGSLPEAQPTVIVFDKDTYEYLGTKNEPLDATGFVDQVGDRV